ncbi:MAG: hypothetical protein KF812_07765 [Fimbriimonadaceae bacterium]|nr:hypothetical protein [Fimbriimonadaceae bacterium]
MGSKAWACITAVTLPFALYAYIGILGRTQVLAFENVEYGPAVAERIYAYGPFLLAADRSSVGDPQDIETRVVEASEEWIRASDEGVLTDILPAALDDQSDSGVKSEIFASRDRLIRSLRKLARSAWAKGDSDRAIRLSTTALRLSEVAKFSDVYSVTRLSLTQRDIVIELHEKADSFTPEQLTQIEATLSSLQDPKVPTDRLVAHIELLHVRTSSQTTSDRALRGLLVSAKENPTMQTARELSNWAKARPFSEALAAISSQLSMMYKSQDQLAEAQSDLQTVLLTKSQDPVLALAD